MWNGTHTEACSLNGYESVIYLTILLVLVLHRISGFMIIIILTAHALLYSLYPPASCLLSYHVLSAVWLYVLRLWWHKIRVYIWGFPCLDYSFDVLVLWSRDLKPYNQICSSSAIFGFIAIHVLTLARHLAFASPLAWGVSSDSPGFSCPGPGAWSLQNPSCWSEWRSGSMNLQQTIWSSILSGPLCASRVFLL